MKDSTTVQPLIGQLSSTAQGHVAKLAECGCERIAAESLVLRLTRNSVPNDRYDEAAMKSIIDFIVAMSNSGGCLKYVC